MLEAINFAISPLKQNNVLVYYNACKGHIGFYPTPEAIVHFKKELEKYSTSKGAIQFPINKPLPLELIKKLLKFRLNEDSKK